MKASLSLAVMALLGHVSATQVSQMSAPSVDAFVQTESHHHGRKHGHQVATPSMKHKRVRDDIHGFLAPSDDNSPYVPDVADAPEDIKRVGNDHEELHNAKLSPDGYYDGFFHKDY